MRVKTVIVHVITGLSNGGAENSLYKLLSNIDKSKFESKVILLTDLGPLSEKIKSIGVPVFSCNIRHNFFGIFKLIYLFYKLRPDVTQTWMYHSDAIGGIIARFTGCNKVIWNIRNTHVFPGQGVSKLTYWVMKFNKFLSYFIPKKIVCVANSSMMSHVEEGYCERKMIVIQNGFETKIFKPNIKTRKLTRQSIKIGLDALVIGSVGRFNKYKNYKNFILAAENLVSQNPNVYFILAGKNLDYSNIELCGWIDSSRIRSHFRLLGSKFDIPKLMTSLDIFCLSSLSEGFPNVLAEAMSSGLPCISTNVGDVRSILLDEKCIVPVDDISLLTSSLLEMINLSDLGREQLGIDNRKRIQSEYSISAMVKKYENLYLEVLHE